MVGLLTVNSQPFWLEPILGEVPINNLVSKHVADHRALVT
jgi:hypothetical protein